MIQARRFLRQPFFLIILCFGLIGLTGCSDNSTGSNGGNGNNNGGGGGGGGNTIGSEPTFDNIQMIFNQSCGGAGCHVNETTSGVRLNTYQNVIGSVGDQYGTEVINPNNADESPLVDKIESDNPEFGVRMPETGNYLSDSRISQIKAWIDNGAENDESGGNNSDGGDGSGDGY